MSEANDFLAHYGVAGMKWGRRKGSSDSGSTKEPRKTRKEVRAINKAGQREFDEKKLTSVISESLKKGDKVLVKSLMQGDTYPTVMTGTEFVDYASRGGLLNPRLTDIYARQKGDAYELNPTQGQRYQKVKR